MFENNNNQPSAFSERGASNQESSQTQFYRAAGNWAEFGTYFSASLTLALLSRLIPQMMVFYGLLLLAAFGAIALQQNPEKQIEARVIGVAIGLSVLGGHWDTLWLLVNLYWMPVCLVLLGITMLVIFVVSRRAK